MNECLFEFRLLKGAHDLQLHKPIKQEFGGGYRVFIFDELEFYEGKICMRECLN